MNLSDRNFWQVGAGDTERSYGEICLKFDVMLAGPGWLGPYDESQYSSLGDIRHSLRRFCTEASRGDVVLLRLGVGDVLAVGVIADDGAQWLEAFADVDGWDLRHVRRVRWFPNTSRSFSSRTFGAKARAFAGVHVKQIKAWVESLVVPEAEQDRELCQLPSTGTSLDPTELGRHLFIEGLSSEYVDRLMATFASLQRIASWYSNETKLPEGRPSEQETVCYLVIPLLLSLCWSQQTAAIQWNYVDVALFRSMPPTDATLDCVVEAKLLDKSVFRPAGQARGYALRPGREGCDRLIVTDGIRYALHSRTGADFMLEAYLNVLDPRDSYPALGCAGAVQAILGMAR